MAIKENRCLICARKSAISIIICPCCNIDKTKTKKDLTTEEKNLLTKFLNIRHVGLLIFAKGMIGLVAFIILCLYEMPPVEMLGGVLFLFMLLIFLIFLGTALGSYQPWTYKTTIAIYSLIFFGSIVVLIYKVLPLAFGFTGIIVSSFILYCLLSSSKAITIVKKNIVGQKASLTKVVEQKASLTVEEKIPYFDESDNKSNAIIYISLALAIIIGLVLLYIARPR